MYPFSRYFVIFCCETILSDLCVYHLILPPSSNRCHRRIDGFPLPSDRPIIEPLNHPPTYTHPPGWNPKPTTAKQAGQRNHRSPTRSSSNTPSRTRVSWLCRAYTNGYRKYYPPNHPHPLNHPPNHPATHFDGRHFVECFPFIIVEGKRAPAGCN